MFHDRRSLAYSRGVPLGPLRSPIFSSISTIIVLVQLWASLAGMVRRPLVWFTIIKADLTFRRSRERNARLFGRSGTDERLRDIKKTLSPSASSFSFPIAVRFFPLLLSLLSLIVRNALSETGETRQSGGTADRVIARSSEHAAFAFLPVAISRD